MSLQQTTELPRLPPRPAASNKETYRRLLLVAGSEGKSGAAILCGSAALRGGAGLVKVATSRAAWPLVAAGNPCYMTVPLEQNADGRFTGAAMADLMNVAKGSDIVGIGPGLGRGQEITM